MQTKSEAKVVFIQFQAMVERMFIRKLIYLQTDWGGEYKSISPLLQKLAIHFRHSCPHAHYQNGRAERKHMHIVELELTLLA